MQDLTKLEKFLFRTSQGLREYPRKEYSMKYENLLVDGTHFIKHFHTPYDF